MRNSDYGDLPGSMPNVAVRTDFATALAGSSAARDVDSQFYFMGLHRVQSDGYVKSKGGYVKDSQAESVYLCYGQSSDCTLVDFYSNARNRIRLQGGWGGIIEQKGQMNATQN